MHILYEDNHLLVVEKPVNIPVQADSSQDEDLLTMAKQYIKEKYQKPGEVYLGLVHRLDRPVGGIMVFARTSKAASRLSDAIRKNAFYKTYHAVVIGDQPEEQAEWLDYLYKDEKTNTSKVVSKDKGKASMLSYQLIQSQNQYHLVEIQLKTGRSHQIRVQFSHHGLPLYGDQRYSKNAKSGEQIALFASKLRFEHPTTKEWMSFSLDLPKRKPWTLFN